MKILVIGKAPPLQGGVANRTLSFVRHLAEAGCKVTYLTNSEASPPTYKEFFSPDDHSYLSNALRGVSHLSISRSNRIDHIPHSQAFETRLIGMGANAAEDADLIVGWYYQPYGVAAAMLAKVYGKKCVLAHAGSDLGRLANQEVFQSSYRALFANSLFLATTPTNAESIQQAFAVSDQQIITAESSRLLPSYFTFKQPPSISLKDLVRETGKHIENWNIRPQYKEWISETNSKAPSCHPIILNYGKVGKQKGQFELVESLSFLAQSGRNFQLLFCIGGHRTNIENLLSEVMKSKELSERTFFIPFIAPWRIPSLIKMSNLVAFLERDFEISFHGPQIPREVMWCGRALLCSEEIKAKQRFAHLLKDGVNYINAGDPKHIDSLTKIIDSSISDLDKLIDIGYQSKYMIQNHYDFSFAEDGYVTALKRSGLLA